MIARTEGIIIQFERVFYNIQKHDDKINVILQNYNAKYFTLPWDSDNIFWFIPTNTPLEDVKPLHKIFYELLEYLPSQISFAYHLRANSKFLEAHRRYSLSTFDFTNIRSEHYDYDHEEEE